MKCADCKKKVWFFQDRGIDNHSHIKCHRHRVMKLIDEAMQDGKDELVTALIKEQIYIERYYAKWYK